VADLADPRVVFELEGRAETLADADPRTYAEQALCDYDAEARRVEEMERFRETAGIGTKSTAIWAN